MKIDPNVVRAMVGHRAYIDDRVGLVDDACEVLTLKIVMWMTRKRKQLVEARKYLTNGSDQFLTMTQEIQVIGKLMTELASTNE